MRTFSDSQLGRGVSKDAPAIGCGLAGLSVLAMIAGYGVAAGAAAAAPHDRDQSSVRAVATVGPSAGEGLSEIQRARSPWMAAVERVAAESSTPARTRSRLLLGLALSSACYRSDLTQAEYDELVRQTRLLPPGLEANGIDRFYSDTQVWVGDGGLGPSSTARRAQLTYSFAPDGTTWGLLCASPSPAGSSVLDAALTNAFGSLDRGREFMRSSIAAWRRVAGLTYTEVADDGSAEDTVTARSLTRGDIRIGGRALGISLSSPLAYNAFPSDQGLFSCAGGDMFINTSYFTPAYFTSVVGNFLFFRNTVAHEHGHGLAMRHSVPCDMTKLMEPSINTLITLLTPDEVRAAGQNYGDRLSGNQQPGTAFDFGNLTSPALRSVIERDLSVNGPFVTIGGTQFAQDDYFRLTLSSSQTVTVTAAPTGVNAVNGPQSVECSSQIVPTPTINAPEAGNLSVQYLDAGRNVIATSPAGTPGQTRTLAQVLAAGQYFVRVWDTGVSVNSANQRVQTYDLTLRVGSAFAPPQAIAGLNKRVQANTSAYFIGNHNSRALEPGATIATSGYAWDLDGDGSFEVLSQGQTSTTYVSNGVYPVTLRVTDSNGRSATDTIQVTVFGATTSVDEVTPSSGVVGASLPVVITGANFKRITMSSQVIVVGGGVNVTGSPVVNARGTTITGLNLVVAPGAALGTRDISVTSPDGLGVGVGVFTVTAGASAGACCLGSTCAVVAAPACVGANARYVGDGQACNVGGNRVVPCCAADFNQSGAVGAQDIFAFLAAWFAPDLSADVGGNGTIDVQDIFDYLAVWFAGC